MVKSHSNHVKPIVANQICVNETLTILIWKSLEKFLNKTLHAKSKHCCKAPKLRFLTAYVLNKYLDEFLGKSGAYKSKYTLNTPFEAYYGAFT